MNYEPEETDYSDPRVKRNIRRKKSQKYKTLPYNGGEYEDYEDFEDEETFEKFSNRK